MSRPVVMGINLDEVDWEPAESRRHWRPGRSGCGS